jgi:amidophosphoribosyltransferase
VHLRISAPPTTGPCYYGVDTPSKDQLIAAHQTLEEIRQFVGADTLAYLSTEGLAWAMDSDSTSPKTCQSQGYCDACFSGDYPTKIDY